MTEDNKAEGQFTSELEILHKRIAELEASETMLRQTEKEQQVSGGRYRSLVDDVLDSSQVGIIVTDAKFKIVWVNQSLECYFGLCRDNVLLKDVRRLIRDRLMYIFEDPKRFMEKALATFQNDTPKGRFECHVMANEELEEWWLEHWAQPIHSGLYAGGVIEYYTDITERKKAEDGLRQSEIRYRRLFEAARDGILILDAENARIVDVNPFLVEILGFSREEFIGKKIWELGFLKDVIANKDKFVELQGKKYVRYESLPLETVSGRRLEVEFVSNVYEVGHQKVIQCNIRDITERKKAEEALRQSEEKLRLMFESVTGGIAVSDLNGIILECNENLCKLLGLGSKDMVLGKSWLNFVSPTEHERTVTETQRIIADGLHTSKEYTMCRTDDSEFPAEVSVGVLKDVSGRPAGYIALIMDITERRNMQEHLILTDRLASIGELASGIAHELNNPLTSVIGFSQLALEKDVPDNIREDLKLINVEAQRTANVVKNLLTFARKHTPAKQLVNMNDLIDKVLELRNYEHKICNVEVVRRFDSDLPEIMADYFQLQQVFLNLIINAEYFMIEAHNRGTLTITTEKLGEMVRIAFADDGLGISEEQKRRLFAPFSTTKPVGKGTGLGLSICHGIVNAHSGRIHAESVSGKGATFFVELPISTKRKS